MPCFDMSKQINENNNKNAFSSAKDSSNVGNTVFEYFNWFTANGIREFEIFSKFCNQNFANNTRIFLTN